MFSYLKLSPIVLNLSVISFLKYEYLFQKYPLLFNLDYEPGLVRDLASDEWDGTVLAISLLTGVSCLATSSLHWCRFMQTPASSKTMQSKSNIDISTDEDPPFSCINFPLLRDKEIT